MSGITAPRGVIGTTCPQHLVIPLDPRRKTLREPMHVAGALENQFLFFVSKSIAMPANTITNMLQVGCRSGAGRVEPGYFRPMDVTTFRNPPTGDQRAVSGQPHRRLPLYRCWPTESRFKTKSRCESGGDHGDYVASGFRVTRSSKHRTSIWICSGERFSPATATAPM